MAIHPSLAAGRWQTLSLLEQMGNIGSEVGRAAKWKGKDEGLYQRAAERALELLDLTIADTRWRHRLKEIIRAREMIVDALTGGNEYRTSFKDLEGYFNSFALAARAGR